MRQRWSWVAFQFWHWHYTGTWPSSIRIVRVTYHTVSAAIEFVWWARVRWFCQWHGRFQAIWQAFSVRWLIFRIILAFQCWIIELIVGVCVVVVVVVVDDGDGFGRHFFVTASYSFRQNGLWIDWIETVLSFGVLRWGRFCGGDVHSGWWAWPVWLFAKNGINVVFTINSSFGIN